MASAFLAATVLATGTLIAPATANAQASQSYDIPAGSLAAALNRFVEASGVALVYDSALTSGLSSSGLKGSFGTVEALSRLLAGTGLTYRQTGPNAFTLERAPQAAAGAVQLGPVRVEGDGAGATGRYANIQESGTGPVVGYVAKRTATGTKTDTAITEIPQSVSVVTADQVEALKAQSLTEALAYTPGIARLEGYDRTSDGFMVRGFEAYAGGGSIYRDGTKYTANLYDGQQEPYGLERIEILRGAASVLFGSAAPGGIVNTITKKPTDTPLHELNLELGNYSRKQISADFGGPLTEGGALSYRLTGLMRDSDTFIDHVPDNRIYIAPALKWQPATGTSLTLLGFYQRNRTTYAYGLPPVGTLFANPNGAIPSTFFVGEPDYDKYEGEILSAGYQFEHGLAEGVTLHNSLRWLRADIAFPNVSGDYLDTDQRSLIRSAYDRWDRSSTISSDSSVEVRRATGGLTHTILMGFDYTRQHFETERYTRTIDPIDIYAPVYGAKPGDPMPMGWSSMSKSDRFGVYLSDQIKAGKRWVIVLGGRHDWSRDRTSPFFTPSWTTDKSSAFTGRAGVVYLGENGLAPFVSFSQSFEPQSGTDSAGERLKPTRGEQVELGLRYQPVGSDVLLSAAVYQLKQRNVVSYSPDYSFANQTGEVRSRGVELEAKANLSASFSLIGAYAYTDAKITKSNNPDELGHRQHGVPRHQASVWGEYRFAVQALPGTFKVGLGARYVDDIPSIWWAGDLTVPGYTVFDGMLAYETEGWRFSANATNLADKKYISNCTYGSCFYGNRLQAIGAVRYRW
ncbi:iron complex outermembrane recepter protein [Novosphingobium sp. CF614]|uniref:TonB-dependent siderophore receptor n=1 Tax=Novosphingobium sp. CF614 TaxID=1884364 RepID=UPI0008F206D7|nr:TonB-dependent siderophore receptor [Novosphingobium sp. CF614]SFG34466.1 iron complex outermembrane recepter protein [Novosphingobium sp. CF614]